MLLQALSWTGDSWLISYWCFVLQGCQTEPGMIGSKAFRHSWTHRSPGPGGLQDSDPGPALTAWKIIIRFGSNNLVTWKKIDVAKNHLKMDQFQFLSLIWMGAPPTPPNPSTPLGRGGGAGGWRGWGLASLLSTAWYDCILQATA